MKKTLKGLVRYEIGIGPTHVLLPHQYPKEPEPFVAKYLFATISYSLPSKRKKTAKRKRRMITNPI